MDTFSTRGYTPLSADTQVRLLAHLSQWLEVRGLGVSELTEDRIHEFLSFRRSSGRSALLSPRCMLPLQVHA